jgi:hypothetical protein
MISKTRRSEVFERLRAANPIAGSPELPSLELSAVGEAHVSLVPGRRWVRPVLVLALLVATFFVVAPALGLRLPSLDFWSAEKASPEVVADFASMDTGAPRGMGPGVIARQTRLVERVRVGGKLQELWVGQTRSGGYCVEWSQIGGGCDKHGVNPLDVFGVAESTLPPSERSSPPTAHYGGEMKEYLEKMRSHMKQIDIAGDVKSKWSSSVEIRFADGTVLRPDIFWVGPPIDLGFFSYTVTPEHQQPGHGISSVVALDKDGNVVATDRGMDYAWRPPLNSPPEDALVGQKRVMMQVEAPGGAATIYSAPTRYDSSCYWLELNGRIYGGGGSGGCLSNQDLDEEMVSLRFIPTTGAVVLWGQLGELSGKTGSVELRYADGDSATFRPRDHQLLVSIPPEHLRSGHQVVEVVVRDASLRVIQDETGFFRDEKGEKHPIWSGCSSVLPIPRSVAETCR